MRGTPRRRLKAVDWKVWILIALLPTLATSQESAFVGEWLLWLEQGNARRPAYGTLTIEPSGGSVNVYIDGGPVNLLALEDNRIRFDFDWTDVGDRVHLSILEGVLDDGVLAGTVTEEGEPRGMWRATPKPLPESPPPAPDPADLTGIWGGPAIISKYSFDQTEAGRAAQAAYDLTIDDPILRCVSDGLMRMSHGPFDIEVVEGRGRIFVLHEDLHEVRRIHLDGRSFPDGIDDAHLSMGYSIGRWEGSTLVVQTRGLKRAVWDAAGMPFNAGAAVTERWYLDDDGNLHIEFSLSDPINYYRPILMHQVRERLPDDSEIGEYSCDPHAFYRGLQLDGRLEEYWGRSRNRL